MDPRLSRKVMFRNPPGVTGQGYGDTPFTYIHTYSQAFIPAFFAGGHSHHGRRVSSSASYAHAGGAQQEVFKNFTQFMMNSTLLQSEFCIFRILRLILIKLFVKFIANSLLENVLLSTIVKSDVDHLLFLVAINLSSS